MEHEEFDLEANDQFDTQSSRIELPVSFSQIIWSSNENFEKIQTSSVQLRRIYTCRILISKHLHHTHVILVQVRQS